MLLYHSSPSALLSLLPRNLELIATNIIDGCLRAVLSVILTHAVTESDATLQLIQQHALAVLHHRLIVRTLLQVCANLGHDVRVHRF